MRKCYMQHYKNDTAKGVQCSFYRIKIDKEFLNLKVIYEKGINK